MRLVSLLNLRHTCGRCGAFVLLIAIALGVPGGCDREPDSVAGETVGPVRQSATRGPVTLTVSSDVGELAVGDPLGLTVDVVVDPGVEISMPAFEETIGPFDILQRSTPPDVPDGDKRRWTHRYLLSTFDSGQLQIPEITIGYIDGRGDRSAAAGVAEPVESELTVEPLTIVVTSVLADDFDPTAIRDIRGVVDIPLERSPWAIWGPVVGVLVIVLGLSAVWLLARRRRRGMEQAAPPEPPAHVWAVQRLDELAVRQLPQRGEVQEYYSCLSDVVRQYIERRFGLMAPERTTDEFLREIERGDLLKPAHRGMLTGFLRAADMVKFALHRPPVSEGDEAMAAARSFVRETAGMESGSPDQPDDGREAGEGAA